MSDPQMQTWLENKIWPSTEAAQKAFGHCPRSKSPDGGHWWYLDMPEDNEVAEEQEYIPCVCGTCGQKMKLSIDAPEYPV